MRGVGVASICCGCIWKDVVPIAHKELVLTVSLWCEGELLSSPTQITQRKSFGRRRIWDIINYFLFMFCLLFIFADLPVNGKWPRQLCLYNTHTHTHTHTHTTHTYTYICMHTHICVLFESGISLCLLVGCSGSCRVAGYTDCCEDGDCSAEGRVGGTCHCDTHCHGFRDCCTDIDTICPLIPSKSYVTLSFFHYEGFNPFQALFKLGHLSSPVRNNYII